MHESPYAEFTWQAPADGNGLVWVRQKTHFGTVEDQIARLPDAVFHEYKPLAQPIALYRELARTEPTKEATIAFANRYGILGNVLRGHSELFTMWQRVIADLAAVVRVWDLLRVEDWGGLAELFVSDTTLAGTSAAAKSRSKKETTSPPAPS
jgi:hypothetical protein